MCTNISFSTFDPPWENQKPISSLEKVAMAVCFVALTIFLASIFQNISANIGLSILSLLP